MKWLSTFADYVGWLLTDSPLLERGAFALVFTAVVLVVLGAWYVLV